MYRLALVKIFIIMIAASCDNENIKEQHTPGSFGYDLDFLKKYDSVIVLTNGESKIIVSSRYQGKVFTSSAEGSNGKSFGWINYKAFDAAPDPHMNAYGGENRLWLGPEGGIFSLYFRTGDSMVFDNWKTPPPFDTESWNTKSISQNTAILQKKAAFRNYSGFLIDVNIDREITIQTKEEIETALNIELKDSIKYVGYSTSNKLTNTGSQDWTKDTGMPCIWILDMFNPSDSTTIIIPHKPPISNEKIATTDYFGEINKSRIRRNSTMIFFKADGKERGKLGVVPGKVLPVAGSYDARDNVLTVTKFSVDNQAKYLNQEWKTGNDPFTGDAMNVYNDGPLSNGTQMGPFYEIESISPAIPLKQGESFIHEHNVYHFTGNKIMLNAIAQKIFNISLQEINSVFNSSTK